MNTSAFLDLDTRRQFLVKVCLLMVVASLPKVLRADGPIVIDWKKVGPQTIERLRQNVALSSVGDDWEKAVRAIAAIEKAAQRKKLPNVDYRPTADSISKIVGTVNVDEVVNMFGVIYAAEDAKGLITDTGFIRQSISNTLTSEALRTGSDAWKRLTEAKNIESFIPGYSRAIIDDELAKRATEEVRNAIAVIDKLEKYARAEALNEIQIADIADVIGPIANIPPAEIQKRVEQYKAAERVFESIKNRKFDLSSDDAVAISSFLLTDVLNVPAAEVQKFSTIANLACEAAALYAMGPCSAMGAISFASKASSVLGGGGDAQGAQMAELKQMLREVISRLQRIEEKLDKVLLLLADIKADLKTVRVEVLDAVKRCEDKVTSLLAILIEDAQATKLTDAFGSKYSTLERHIWEKTDSRAEWTDRITAIEDFGRTFSGTLFTFLDDPFLTDANTLTSSGDPSGNSKLNVLAPVPWFGQVDRFNLGSGIPPFVGGPGSNKSVNPVYWGMSVTALSRLLATKYKVGNLKAIKSDAKAAVQSLKVAGANARGVFDPLSAKPFGEAYMNKALSSFHDGDTPAYLIFKDILDKAVHETTKYDHDWKEEISKEPVAWPNGGNFVCISVKSWSITSPRILKIAQEAAFGWKNKPILSAPTGAGKNIVLREDPANFLYNHGADIIISPDPELIKKPKLLEMWNAIKGNSYVAHEKAGQYNCISGLGPFFQGTFWWPSSAVSLMDFAAHLFAEVRLRYFVSALKDKNIRTEISSRNDGHKDATRSFIRSALYANLSLATAIWRAGGYPEPAISGGGSIITPQGGTESVMKANCSQAAQSEALSYPVPLGHRGELIFNPSEIWGRMIDLLENAEPIQIPYAGRKWGFGWGYRNASGQLVQYAGGASLTDVCLDIIKNHVMDRNSLSSRFMAGFPDNPKSTIPPLEIGFAKLRAIDALLS